MKTFLLACLLTLTSFGAHAQGSLVFHNTGGLGKEKYVFLSCYAGTSRQNKLEGSGYTAELWFAPAPGALESSLAPVPGSQVGFRTGASAGLIQGKSKLDIPGTFGGDIVTLQLRVWNNDGGKFATWAQAVEKVAGNVFEYGLEGLDQNGVQHEVIGNVSDGMSGNLFLICPEPSVVTLSLLSLGLLRLRRRS